MRVKWGKIILGFLLIWLIIILYMLGPLWKSSEESERLAKKLHEAKNEITRLSGENYELRTMLKKMQHQSHDSKEREVEEVHPLEPNVPVPVSKEDKDLDQLVSKIFTGPTKEYEMLRRQIFRDTNEMWWYVRSRLDHVLGKFGKDNHELSAWINRTLAETQHHQKAVLVDIEKLPEVDGFADWRAQENRDLSELVQKRLKTLQNPDDCSKARRLVCNLNKGCGYGCQIHHAIYCFLVAYGTERTLVLKSKGWRYNRNGFEDVFLPLSETCTGMSGASKQHWPASEDSLIVEIPIVDSINPRPKYLPPAIPKDLADRIMRIHGDPIVWWISQFLKYFLRPQPSTAQLLKDFEKDMGLEKPMVGIHIRRTDKVGTEAAFHPVEEYMKYVDEYYQKVELQEGKIETKRVYVATDDPKVLAECRKKFPGYTFLGDQKVAKSAAVSSRYSSSALKGIINDIHMLSRADFLVCTFSSQVCRIAYEIMQQYIPDASDRFKSLDDIWYYGGQDEHQQLAVMEHSPSSKEEIELKPGDVIGVAGNHWNGLNKGRNHRSNRVGLYPQYKTREKYKIVDFPTYPHVKL